MMMRCLEVEAAAMASCAQTNAQTPWREIAMDATNRPVMACHVGDRSRTRAKRLGAKMPDASHQHATGDTDPYVVYARVIPTAQPRTTSTRARNTPHIERFNYTLRPRVSRVVREALSCFTKLANPIGAIKVRIGHDHLTTAPA
jgi:insertion element IS1 protein InsB